VSSPNEFIFGELDQADRFARAKRWRPDGRAAWAKPNGTCVHFIRFSEQLSAVGEGERVYVLGKLSASDKRTLKQNGAVVIQAGGKRQ